MMRRRKGNLCHRDTRGDRTMQCFVAIKRTTVFVSELIERWTLCASVTFINLVIIEALILAHHAAHLYTFFINAKNTRNPHNDLVYAKVAQSSMFQGL
jgi:hypothetical protein